MRHNSQAGFFQSHTVLEVAAVELVVETSLGARLVMALGCLARRPVPHERDAALNLPPRASPRVQHRAFNW